MLGKRTGLTIGLAVGALALMSVASAVGFDNDDAYRDGPGIAADGSLDTFKGLEGSDRIDATALLIVQVGTVNADEHFLHGTQKSLVTRISEVANPVSGISPLMQETDDLAELPAIAQTMSEVADQVSGTSPLWISGEEVCDAVKCAVAI